MIKIEDVTPGESYACKFRVKNIPLDRYGRPGGQFSLADMPVERHGDYESLGLLVARDMNTRLVRLQDERTKKEFVVSFDDIWDVDTVEYVDPLETKE